MSNSVYVVGTAAGAKRNQYEVMTNSKEEVERLLAANEGWVAKTIDPRNLKPRRKSRG